VVTKFLKEIMGLEILVSGIYYVVIGEKFLRLFW